LVVSSVVFVFFVFFVLNVFRFGYFEFAD